MVRAALWLAMFSLSVLAEGSDRAGEREGWRMVDRFLGFRFAVDGSSVSEAEVVQEADRQACFGWVQRTVVGGLVGEARCHKARGATMVEWLRTNDPAAEIKVYPDTKIRLHFSHFKVLDSSRDTCFTDPPHQCSDTPAFRDSDPLTAHSAADEL